jgi:hypothetical protein
MSVSDKNLICGERRGGAGGHKRIREGVYVLLGRILRWNVECPDVSGQTIPHRALPTLRIWIRRPRVQ